MRCNHKGKWKFASVCEIKQNWQGTIIPVNVIILYCEYCGEIKKEVVQ